MQKLLIGTANPAKFREYREGLADLGFEIISAREAEVGNVEETGTTFEENAELKAREYFKQTGLPVVVDDGGLEIEALEGEPGVHSRRSKNGTDDMTDDELITHVLERMHGVTPEKRGAQFRIVAGFYDGEHLEMVTEATKGHILTEAHPYESGFPYRALFLIERFGKRFDELTPEEHELVNHRVKAIAKLKPLIKARLGI